MVGAAIFFAAYGIFGGIIVPKCTFGLGPILNYDTFMEVIKMPVQILRAACAFFITIFVGNSLTIFDYELQLREDRELRERAILDERSRIALDLHDGIQQILYSIGLRADSALRKTRDDGAMGVLEDIRALSQKGITEIRDTVTALRVDREQELTLFEAVKTVASELFGRTLVKIDMEFQSPGLTDAQKVTEKVIFRFFQEGLLNIHKHAHATHVKIEMTEHDGSLNLKLQDDGIGLKNLPSSDEKGKNEISKYSGDGKTGLRGMNERISKIGGSLTIESPPGGGTTLKAVIPLKKGEDE